MAKPKRWPAGSYEPYQAIVNAANLLSAMTLTAKIEGAQGKNKELVKRLNRLIIYRADEIREQARIIAVLLDKSPRGGRQPKWFTITLEVQAAAMTIIELSKEVEAALRTNELRYIETLLECVAGKLKYIKNLLAEHPNTDGLWQEFIEKEIEWQDES